MTQVVFLDKGLAGPAGPAGAGLPASGADGDVVVKSGSSPYVYTTVPLQTRNVFGTGIAATDTAAVQGALDALATAGVGGTVCVVGTAALNARLAVPSLVNLVGTGVNWSTGAGTRFLCTTTSAGITFDTGAGGLGGHSGNFTLDVNQVVNTTAALTINQSTDRTFSNITVWEPGGDGILLYGTQNCAFTSVHCFHCEATAMTLDGGAAGNHFLLCQMGRAVKHLYITHTPADGAFGPMDNTWTKCLFEWEATISGAFTCCVDIDAGFGNLFQGGCTFHGRSSDATDEPYVRMALTHGLGGAFAEATIDSCTWRGVTGSSPFSDTAIQHNSGGLYLTGHNTFHNMKNGWEYNGGYGYIHGHLQYQGVTNRWTGSGSASSRPRERTYRPQDMVIETTDPQLFRGYQQGDTQPRLEIDSNGVIKWSTGAAVSDIQVRRVASATAQFDGNLIVTGNFRQSGAGATLGFYGATAITKPTVAAAATDAATTQTLANSLRTALINLGLVS